MKKWMHRGMSMVLAVLLLSSLFTFGVYADETETVPEETGFTIDTESAVYAAFEEAAKGLSARQILVYDSTNDQVLYVKAPEGGKLYPASVTKLFTCYAALQIRDTLAHRRQNRQCPELYSHLTEDSSTEHPRPR